MPSRKRAAAVFGLMLLAVAAFVYTSTRASQKNKQPAAAPAPQNQPPTITFTASISGGTAGVTPVYNWKVSAGKILSGQGTQTITVDTSGLAGQPISATVEVEGYSLECHASCQSSVPAPPNPTKFDEIGEIQRDDEKARLDVFAIELQNSPGSQGYVIAYGSKNKRFGTGQQRGERAKEYLTGTRGIDASR